MKCFALYLEPDRCSGNVSVIIFIIFISIITISSIYCYVTNCLSTTIHSLMNLQFWSRICCPFRVTWYGGNGAGGPTSKMAHFRDWQVGAEFGWVLGWGPQFLYVGASGRLFCLHYSMIAKYSRDRKWQLPNS